MVNSLTIADSSVTGLSESTFFATSYTISRAACTSVAIRASMKPTPSKLPMAVPKALRSFA